MSEFERKASKGSLSRRRSSVRRASIDPGRLGGMTMSKIARHGTKFNLLYIGAGNINFGSDEGPWNHSFRIEHKLGTRLNVVAVIDPMTARAQEVLDDKCASFVRPAYENARVCASFDEFIETMGANERPQAIIIGSPAGFRGSDKPGRDLELKILKAFPNKTPAMFIEKPISADLVDNVRYVDRALLDAKTTVSVGYFLRYLKVVQKMRQVIEENELHVMATVARYIASYAKIAKPAWWMLSKDCGPIVEQGTHFCDLSRYFGGDVDLSTVQAHSLEWYEEAGELSSVPIDELAIAEKDRIPRVTSATWKYETGAVGSLTHALVLQGTKYSTELEVYADGYQLRLIDPYNNPTVIIRHPENDDEEKYQFPNDDPYFGELGAFIDACDPDSHGASAVADDDEMEILSSYEDATKTYALSWAIRTASEQSAKKPRKSPRATPGMSREASDTEGVKK